MKLTNPPHQGRSHNLKQVPQIKVKTKKYMFILLNKRFLDILYHFNSTDEGEYPKNFCLIE